MFFIQDRHQTGSRELVNASPEAHEGISHVILRGRVNGQVKEVELEVQAVEFLHERPQRSSERKRNASKHKLSGPQKAFQRSSKGMKRLVDA